MVFGLVPTRRSRGHSPWGCYLLDPPEAAAEISSSESLESMDSWERTHPLYESDGGAIYVGKELVDRREAGLPADPTFSGRYDKAQPPVPPARTCPAPPAARQNLPSASSFVRPSDRSPLRSVHAELFGSDSD